MKMWKVFFTCWVAAVMSLGLASTGKRDLIQKLESYDRRVSPNTDSGSPLIVKVSMYILALKVDDHNQELESQMYFRQSWRDRRLQYEDEGTSKRYLNFDDVQKIWHPDLFFIDESNARLNTVPFPNTFLHWRPQGDMLMSMRLSMTTRCKMDFVLFPHDRHTCSFRIESYGYSAENVLLEWDEERGSFGMSDTIQGDDFDVIDIQNSNDVIPFKQANYSTLLVKITIARKSAFYTTNLYIPYVLLTCVSFLSLWMSHKLIVPRLALTLSVIFVMLTLASYMQTYIPQVQYTKSIDIWMAFSIIVVFGVFLEFIILLISLKVKKDDQESEATILDAESLKNNEKEKPFLRKIFPFSSSLFHYKFGHKRHTSSNTIDCISRYIFPLLYGIFNVIYWSLYAS